MRNHKLFKLETTLWKSKKLGFGKFRLHGYWKITYALFIRVLLISSLLSFAGIIDLFGLATLTSFHSKTLFYQWTAHWYEGSDKSEVTVVMLRDESFKGSWPVSHMVHADILSEIRGYDPKAVFVDFAFIDERDNAVLKDELIPVIKNYRSKDHNQTTVDNNKPPIYLLSIAPSEKLHNGILLDLWKTRATTVSGPVEDPIYRGLTYSARPLKDRVAPYQEDPLAAAFKIFKDTQSGHEFEIEDMEIVWRLYSTPEQNNGPYKCIQQCENIILKIFQRGFDFLPTTVSNFVGTIFPTCVSQASIRQQCPPIYTVDAYHLLNVVTDDVKNDLYEALNGKYIFYGADLDAIDDDILPPTHQPIPGVYFHAMAMDNLLTYKNNYIRHQPQSYLDDALNFICLFLLIFINEIYITILHGINRKKSGKRVKAKKSFFQNIGADIFITFTYLIFFITLLSLGTIANFYYFRLSPLNFLGLATLIGLRLSPKVINTINDFFKKNLLYRILFNN